MKTPVPARNWGKWWYAYIAHFATGAISGAGVGAAISTGNPIYALAFLVSVLVQVRQTIEFLRRFDTPGVDLGDHLAGFVCAGLITAGVLWLL